MKLDTLNFLTQKIYILKKFMVIFLSIKLRNQNYNIAKFHKVIKILYARKLVDFFLLIVHFKDIQSSQQIVFNSTDLNVKD